MDTKNTQKNKNMKEEHNLREAFESGHLQGENRILKQILEQILKIELIPKFKGGFL